MSEWRVITLVSGYSVTREPGRLVRAAHTALTSCVRAWPNLDWHYEPILCGIAMTGRWARSDAMRDGHEQDHIGAHVSLQHDRLVWGFFVGGGGDVDEGDPAFDQDGRIVPTSQLKKLAEMLLAFAQDVAADEYAPETVRAAARRFSAAYGESLTEARP